MEVFVLVVVFWGTHSRVAERTRLFPEGEYSGEVLSYSADLAWGQEHKNTWI